MRLFLIALASLTIQAQPNGRSVYVGDAQDLEVRGMAVDHDGNTYVAGKCLYPAIQDGIRTTSSEAFLTKIDTFGNIVFRTVYGGKGNDAANAVAVDPAGNSWIVGLTDSRDLPVRGALLSQAPGRLSSGFLAKFSPEGQLLYSSYFGGSAGTGIGAIAVDKQENIYVAGSTNSFDFPTTPGAYLERTIVHAGTPTEIYAAFITKLNPAADRILYSTYLGGHSIQCFGGSTCSFSTRGSSISSIAVDSQGSVVAAGFTNTSDFPLTPGALNGTHGSFIAKLNPEGSALTYSFRLGIAGFGFNVPLNMPDTIAALALDAVGNVYFTGATINSKLPITTGALQSQYTGPEIRGNLMGNPPQTDAYVIKLNPDGTEVLYGTFLGGAGVDRATAIALDEAGNIYLTGATSSPKWLDPDGAFGTGGNFVAVIQPDRAEPLAAIRLPEGVGGSEVSVDGADRIYLANTTGMLAQLPSDLAPSRVLLSIANAASELPNGKVAPGEIVTLEGYDLGPEEPATMEFDELGAVTKQLAGVIVEFDDLPSPLLMVSRNRVQAVAPYGIAGKSEVTVKLTNNGVRVSELRLAVSRMQPALFRDPASTTVVKTAVLNEDGTANSRENPAPLGSVVSVRGTGFGLYNPPAADGEIAASTGSLDAVMRVTASSVPGVALSIHSAGSTAGEVSGVTTFHFRIEKTPRFQGLFMPPQQLVFELTPEIPETGPVLRGAFWVSEEAKP